MIKTAYFCSNVYSDWQSIDLWHSPINMMGHTNRLIWFHSFNLFAQLLSIVVLLTILTQSVTRSIPSCKSRSRRVSTLLYEMKRKLIAGINGTKWKVNDKLKAKKRNRKLKSCYSLSRNHLLTEIALNGTSRVYPKEWRAYDSSYVCVCVANKKENERDAWSAWSKTKKDEKQQSARSRLSPHAVAAVQFTTRGDVHTEFAALLLLLFSFCIHYY